MSARVAAARALGGAHECHRATVVQAQRLRKAQLQAGGDASPTVSVGLVSPRSTCESIGPISMASLKLDLRLRRGARARRASADLGTVPEPVTCRNCA
jgi:hypothetical protein